MQTAQDRHVASEIEWFNAEIAQLADRFKRTLVARGHSVVMEHSQIELNEQPSGVYRAHRFDLSLDDALRVSLVPFAIWIVGARGRVDLTGPAGKEKLVYFSAGGPSARTEISQGGVAAKSASQRLFDDIDEDGWYWYDDSSAPSPIKLSEEIVPTLVSRVS